MPTLTELTALHGFPAGDIDTDGYLAIIPAFQKVYFADGRDYDDKGFHKLDFLNTKIVGTSAAGDNSGKFTRGEAVTQASSGAKGVYDECTGVKLTITGSIGDVDVPFLLGEKVTQASSGAIGYVTYVGLASAGTGFINVCPVSRNATTGALVDFAAATDTITGATSGATAAEIGAVSGIGTDKFHFIYRTTTTEFDEDNAITGLLSGAILTPLTAADGSPDVGACVQHVYTVTGAGSDGTFTLTYDGETTTAIAFNATAATIKTALEVLSTVAVDDIAVTFQSGSDFSAVTPTNAMILTFKSTLGSVTAVTGTESMGTATAILVKTFTTGFTTITAPPHWLTWKPVAQWVDPNDDTALVTNPGIMPDGGSNIGVLCFSRIFLNSMQNPHQWFCTRKSEPLDMDSSQTDISAATTGQNVVKAGLVGAPIIAMVSYKDLYLIMGCTSEVYVMRSDPLYGGVNTPVSKETGFFSPESWCWDDQNNLYFLGIDGIYVLTSDAIIGAQPPKNITQQRIPKLITQMGLNRLTDRVAMKYDKQRYGIVVSATQKDGAWSTVFWLDLRTGGVFPDKYPDDQSPASLLYFDSYKTSERGLLYGGYDGYIRKADDDEKDDEGSNAINSFFTTGPFVNDIAPREKVITGETSITVGEETDGLTVEIFKADSGDELIKNIIAGATPAATKTLTGDGLKSSIRDRVSGRAVAMKFGNSEAGESYSIEEINTKIVQSGKEK